MPSYWTSLQNTAAYRLKELDKGENSGQSLRKELDALGRDLQVSRAEIRLSKACLFRPNANVRRSLRGSAMTYQTYWKSSALPQEAALRI